MQPIDESVHAEKMKWQALIRDNNPPEVYEVCEWCDATGLLLEPGEGGEYYQCPYCTGYGIKVYFDAPVKLEIPPHPTPEETYDAYINSEDGGDSGLPTDGNSVDATYGGQPAGDEGLTG